MLARYFGRYEFQACPTGGWVVYIDGNDSPSKMFDTVKEGMDFYGLKPHDEDGYEDVSV